jgi:carbon starvation protein
MKNIYVTIAVIVAIPIIITLIGLLLGMNALLIVLLAVIVQPIVFKFYASRVDRDVIQADRSRATPAKMYMDGVDFMPTNRSVLAGYHFKSIAAAGPIVGVITATNLWGWVPAMLWLILGVSFIGWVSDYSALVVAVRNDGNSLSAIAHRLIAPRTRLILFVFIFFYLLLVAGAFTGIMAATMDARPDTPLGIIMLAVMGLLGGQMLYRWKLNLVTVTLIVVVVTLVAMAVGPLGQFNDADGKLVQGPIGAAIVGLNNGLNRISGGNALFSVVDPTNADPRIPPPGADGTRPTTPKYDAASGQINTLPSYIFWVLFLLVFSYLGSVLPIWRFAQPVNYIGFWVTTLIIGLSALGAILGIFTNPQAISFQGAAFKGFQPVPAGPNAPIQPLWPMLFVTIACGAISGWHALFGSVGTARQIEYETDMLPVGGGAMLIGENSLALLSLVAVSIAGGAGAGAFAGGVGKLLNLITFGALPLPFGTALGFGAFIIIVLTVVQLVFRVMRVTLTEWLGDSVPALRNMHISTIVSMVLTILLVLSGTWIYLWQLFGASNQLMAALSLLIVTVWLVEQRRNPLYAGIPMIFMYVTTMAASLVTAWNMYRTVLLGSIGQAGRTVPFLGGIFMVVVALLLFVAAALIAWDGWKAYQRYQAPTPVKPARPAAQPRG